VLSPGHHDISTNPATLERTPDCRPRRKHFCQTDVKRAKSAILPLPAFLNVDCRSSTSRINYSSAFDTTRNPTFTEPVFSIAYTVYNTFMRIEVVNGQHTFCNKFSNHFADKICAETAILFTSLPAESNFIGPPFHDIFHVTLDDSKLMSVIPAKPSPLDYISTALVTKCFL